ncbi:MAG: DUF362 domain-containing protein [Proteobacteria bacterium]|nr:DUF362 domain-containing protein [Pseudomonadota bacterium]MBU1740754.1 DUF362 domain-containing protein [Pseudomonadota bacterium]
MIGSAEVMFADTAAGLGAAVFDVLEHFGGTEALLKSSRDVYLKVNAVDLKPYSFTDPEVVRQVILYFLEGGARRVYVLDNCTQGNFTRLVFKGTGLTKVCRETGAVPVFLDETGAVPVFLEGVRGFVDISSFVYQRLIEDADRNLHVSLPKLKTHSMTGVTLSLKNQFGLVHQHSRIADHNFRLHQKLADLYRIVRPDFVLVDGLVATNHGHYMAERHQAECVVPLDCLIGGLDPLAVDAVGAAFLGFEVADVPHLALAAATGPGRADLAHIRIVNDHLFTARRQQLTHHLLDRFPPDLAIIRGRERCCDEGCRRNTETVAQVIHADHAGRGGFTIVLGRGADPARVAAIRGPVHLAGDCAVDEWGRELVGRLGRRRVTMSRGCNDLAQTIKGLCRQMGVHPLKLAALNPVSSLAALIAARAKGTRANIVPLW